MNALCNFSHEVTLLLVSNDDFCSFIEIQESTRKMILAHYMNQQESSNAAVLGNSLVNTVIQQPLRASAMDMYASNS